MLLSVISWVGIVWSTEKLTDEYQDPDWITSSRCVFSRITHEFSTVLTVLRSEFLSQPVTDATGWVRDPALSSVETVLISAVILEKKAAPRGDPRGLVIYQ